MSDGINKVILIGNLGQEPDLRVMANQQAVCNISVATNRSWTDRTTGEKKTSTQWHRVSLFRKMAEVAGNFLRTGSKVYIEGRLENRRWKDANGEDHFTTEIVADKMQMLGGNQPTLTESNS